MNSYIELSIVSEDQRLTELLIARLSEHGYDGFLEEEGYLKAYINEASYDPSVPESMARELYFSFTTSTIMEENWNAIWESSFDPVIVDNYVAVRADFHRSTKNVEYEIVITPKMSFGTGHHATTYLMIREMRHWDWRNKVVLDFGTGTGILAILAAKSGAAHVLAIDNDPWSIENSRENLARNDVKGIELLLSEEIPPRKSFDLILANINRHILVEHAENLLNSLKTGGTLVISGILRDDQDHILAAFSQFGKPIRTEVKNNWLLMAFIK